MFFDYDLKNLDSLSVDYKRKQCRWRESDLIYIVQKFIKVMSVLENNFCSYQEISLRMIKVYPLISAEGELTYGLRLLNPFLQTKYFMKYLSENLEAIENGPSGAKNNLFLFDALTRKNFLKQKSNDESYARLSQISREIEQNSKSLVY